MRISRSTLLAALVASACSIMMSATTAFTIPITTTTTTLQQPSTNYNKNSPTSTSLHMKNNFFGGGGAAGTRSIDYNALEHPGPELGAAAERGDALVSSTRDPHLQAATFAGACFWGPQLLFERIPGVMYSAVGYTQGPEQYPNYNAVCSGMTGHTEAVIVYYDPKECSYDELLDAFFGFIDPTVINGQGNDRGRQYRTGVYVHTPEQEEMAKRRFEEEQKKYKRPIATELEYATPFWPAEKYHQNYLEKGGRFGQPQSADKGVTEDIRCYG